MKPPTDPNQIRIAHLLGTFYSQQSADVLHTLLIHSLRTNNPINLNHWLKPMVGALQPAMLRYWQAGFQRTNQRLHRLLLRRHTYKSYGQVQKGIGINWNLFNPRIMEAVDRATLQFCQETNDTATSELNKAITELRNQLKEGLGRGEAYQAISNRVRKIFNDPARAWRIAITESSRAIHGGQMLAAKESGLKLGKRWIASQDACRLCQDMVKLGTIALDQPFWINPKGGPYAVCQFPPVHPNDLCTWTEVVLANQQVTTYPNSPMFERYR